MGKKFREDCALLYDGPLREYEINEVGIMILCKVCDKYLELLSGNKNIDLINADERIKENQEITTAKGVEITGKLEA